MADTELNAPSQTASPETSKRASFGKSRFVKGLKRIASAFTLARDFKAPNTAEAALPKTSGTPVYDAHPNKPEGRKSEKPLPALPIGEEASEHLFEKMLKKQSILHEEARRKLNLTQNPISEKPVVDTRAPHSQEGDLWGSVAPRASISKRIDHSTNTGESPIQGETAKTVEFTRTAAPHMKPRMIDTTKDTPEGPAQTATAQTILQVKLRMMDISAGANNTPPSTEYRSLKRSSSASSVGSAQSFFSQSSTNTADTSMSTHDSQRKQQPQQPETEMGTRTRPSLHELYDPYMHMPPRGR